MASSKVKLTSGQEVAPGDYRVSSASIRLRVTRGGASLIFVSGIGSASEIVAEVPLDGLVAVNPEDVAAREAVLSYLAAAWAHHQWPRLNEWMEAEEYAEGLSVWRLRYCHHSGEPIRELIEQEVTEWLTKHPSSS